jgi:hypothetical protein
MITLTDQTKVGTLISSSHRSGTHFLKTVIERQIPGTYPAGEICNDDSLTELEQLTEIDQYKICILNNSVAKSLLLNRQDLLQKWHVINLTRCNKIQHFISHWFWLHNTPGERLQDTGQFKHHGTPHINYKNAITQPQHLDIDLAIAWMDFQKFNCRVPCNATVDYDELPAYATDWVRWEPNQYNLTLSDIFVNHKDIQDVLLNFTA